MGPGFFSGHVFTFSGGLVGGGGGMPGGSGGPSAPAGMMFGGGGDVAWYPGSSADTTGEVSFQSVGVSEGSTDASGIATGDGSGFATTSGDSSASGTGDPFASGSATAEGSSSTALDGSGTGDPVASASGDSLPSDPASEEGSDSEDPFATGVGTDAASGSTDNTSASGSGETSQQVQSYSYSWTSSDGSTFYASRDTTGGEATSTDAAGVVAHYTYDGAGHVTSHTVAYGTADAATTQFVYQGDRLVQVIDPNSNTTTFSYDGESRLVSMTDPLGNTATRTYNDQGQLATITNRNGLTQTFQYDDEGRVIGVTWAAEDGSVLDVLTYTYDSQGLLASASNNNGTYTFTYDSQGRLVHVEEPFGVSLTFGYDEWGNRNLVEDSFGGVTQSTYSQLGELLSLTYSGEGDPTLEVTQTYDAWGNLTGQTRSTDGVEVSTSAYDYDLGGRITSIIHTGGAGALVDEFESAFNSAGRLVSQTDNGQTTSYTYDLVGQLTGDGTASFDYDDNGNREGSNYVTGPGNQVLSDGTYEYSYDDEGNLVEKVEIATGATWTFEYDARNQLTSARHSATEGGPVDEEVEFKYDVFGNRIEQSVDLDGVGPAAAEVTRFAMDGWKNYDGEVVGNESWDVWGDLSAGNTLQTRYLHGDAADQLFARIGADGQRLF